MMRLTDNPIFSKLQSHEAALSDLRFADVKSDKARQQALSLSVDDLVIDLSRHLITEETLDLFAQLADSADLGGQFDRLFAGEVMNVTEKRPVLHMEARTAKALSGDEARKIAIFSDVIRADKSIKDVVNIGIGGSDLGPAMVTKALAPYHNGPRIHFVSNVDPSHLYDVLKNATPERTQFIVTSKTFTTQETMKNATLARAWLTKAGCSPDRHFAAVTAAPDKAAAWGVEPDRIFGFADGIGGRYSLWSAVGLPIMIAIGTQAFYECLKGAHDMDNHVKNTPSRQNLAIMMACIRVFYRNIKHKSAYGIMAYDQRLSDFTRWAQQTEMESNGKSVDRQGQKLDYFTAPIIWGEAGTGAQHSFFQALHQEADICPIDILAPLQPVPDHNDASWQDSHHMLLINALAQAEAFAQGQTNEAEPHRHFAGGRPSSFISWRATTPYALGRLLALYEHITIASGFLWDVNSFDQFGVELGKQMAHALSSVTEPEDMPEQFSAAAEAFLRRMSHSAS
ncbi:MAG: glucose-6-phosphate isomerase [Candidatus Puniceispirillaceae bacterium]